MEPLTQKELNSIVRFTRRGDINAVRQLRCVTFDTLRRLRVGRNLSLAPTGKTPAGSDHADVGSLRDWMAKVQPTDESCVLQIQEIDAAAVGRTT